jgi:hypothetical protein
MWTSAALLSRQDSSRPRSDDLTTTRSHGIVDALTNANVMTFSDKALPKMPAPASGHRSNATATGRGWRADRRPVNRSHARIRAIGERADATLRGRKALIKLRCCPRRATTIVQAIVVLHYIETNRYAG